jgi:choline dehydrogenase-like flavoprotein
MRAAGATATFWTTSPPLPGSMADRPGGRTPISRHIMGGARMGADPATSVFDPWQRLHGVENLLCTDSSVFPTSTGYGPTLTIVALAIRASRALAGLDPLRSTRPPGA